MKDKITNSVADLYAAISGGLTKADVYRTEILSAIAVNVFKKRVELDMGQKAFAEYMGVSQSMVSKWESGDFNISVEKIAELCEKLELVPSFAVESEAEYQQKTKLESRPISNVEVVPITLPPQPTEKKFELISGSWDCVWMTVGNIGKAG